MQGRGWELCERVIEGFTKRNGPVASNVSNHMPPLLWPNAVKT